MFNRGGGGGGWLSPPSTSLCLILEPTRYEPSEKYLHEQMSNLQLKIQVAKNSSHSQEKLEKPVIG